MCCVIGYHPTRRMICRDNRDEIEQRFGALMREGRIRGMHHYGISQSFLIADASEDGYSRFLRTEQSPDVETVIGFFDPALPTIAHCRYSTSGESNQPIQVGSWSVALNGVIDMRTKAEMEAAWGVELQTDNDAELLLALMPRFLTLRDMIVSMPGSIAALFLTTHELIAVRNEKRPLWRTDSLGARWYASTRDVFIRAGFGGSPLVEVEPGEVETCR